MAGRFVGLGRRAYAYSPIEPAFLLEDPYDEEDRTRIASTPGVQPVRRSQWWGWLSTNGGTISGTDTSGRFAYRSGAHTSTRRGRATWRGRQADSGVARTEPVTAPNTAS